MVSAWTLVIEFKYPIISYGNCRDFFHCKVKGVVKLPAVFPAVKI